MRSVGRRVPRLDGWDKVTGAAKYVDDLAIPDLWYGATVRSTDPHSRLKAIQLDPAFDWDCCVTVTASDIPGDNVIALIEDDQPALAEREIRHFAEPIALVAHADRDALLAAKVHIDYRETAPNYDPESPLAKIFKAITISKGDLAKGFAAAEVVVEGE